MASVAEIVQGAEMTVVGSVAGSISGALAEKLGDFLIEKLEIPSGASATLPQAGLNVIVRSTAAAVVFMLTDQAVLAVQGRRTDVTQGMFFSFIFVQSQPELLAAATRFGTALKGRL